MSFRSFLLAFSTLQTSSWILTFGSLNRYLVISKLTRFQFVNRRRCTVAICLCITCSIFLANIHILWLNGYRSSRGNIVCYNNKYSNAYMVWYQRVHLCSYSVFPSIILLTLNILLMRIVFHSKKRLNSHQNRMSLTETALRTQDQQKSFTLQTILTLIPRKPDRFNKTRLAHRNSRKLNLSLITITLSYFILTFPSTVVFSFFRPHIKSLSLRRTLSLLFTNLSTTTHTIRFFIYYCCSVDFRNNFYNLFSFKQSSRL